MTDDESIGDLMARLQAGQDAAAREVFARFTGRLVALARTRLSDRLAGKVDPEDVVQSAYRSFFVRQRDGQFQVDNWNRLWGLLTVITLRKCADTAGRYQAGKRAVARELADAGGDDRPAGWQLAVDRDPTPDEAACLAEAVEALLGAVSDPAERAVLELSLQGYTTAEIAAKLNRAERTVRRFRERARTRLERMQADG